MNIRLCILLCIFVPLSGMQLDLSSKLNQDSEYTAIAASRLLDSLDFDAQEEQVGFEQTTVNDQDDYKAGDQVNIESPDEEQMQLDEKKGTFSYWHKKWHANCPLKNCREKFIQQKFDKTYNQLHDHLSEDHTLESSDISALIGPGIYDPEKPLVLNDLKAKGRRIKGLCTIPGCSYFVRSENKTYRDKNMLTHIAEFHKIDQQILAERYSLGAQEKIKRTFTVLDSSLDQIPCHATTINYTSKAPSLIKKINSNFYIPCTEPNCRWLLKADGLEELNDYEFIIPMNNALKTHLMKIHTFDDELARLVVPYRGKKNETIQQQIELKKLCLDQVLNESEQSHSGLPTNVKISDIDQNESLREIPTNTLEHAQITFEVNESEDERITLELDENDDIELNNSNAQPAHESNAQLAQLFALAEISANSKKAIEPIIFNQNENKAFYCKCPECPKQYQHFSLIKVKKSLKSHLKKIHSIQEINIEQLIPPLKRRQKINPNELFEADNEENNISEQANLKKRKRSTDPEDQLPDEQMLISPLQKSKTVRIER